MNACKHMRIGYNNKIVLANLTADPSPLTSLDHIKNEYGSRLARWDSPNEDGNIVVYGSFPSPQNIEFISIPGINKFGDAELKLEAYLEPDVNKDLIKMPFTPVVRQNVGDFIPMGEFEFGVDAWGLPRNGSAGVMPVTFTHYFEQKISCTSFKLTIRRSENSLYPLINSLMRMLYMGDVIEFESEISSGNTIRLVDDPRNTRTRGGSAVPTRRQNRSRMFSLSMESLTNRDVEALGGLEEHLLGAPFIVTAFPGAKRARQYDNYNMLARFDRANEYQQRFVDRYQSTILLSEV